MKFIIENCYGLLSTAKESYVKFVIVYPGTLSLKIISHRKRTLLSQACSYIAYELRSFEFKTRHSIQVSVFVLFIRISSPTLQILCS